MLKVILRSLLLLMVFWGGSAQAALTIEITQGVKGAMPIAIVPFTWEGPGSAAPLDITKVVTDNLYRSGRFSPLPERDMLAHPSDPSKINFKNWRILGVENLVVGKIRAAANNQYIVQFVLFDVFRSSQITGQTFHVGKISDLRKTAHQVSDVIYEALLGERGAFDTKVAYITQSQDRAGKPRYSLQVADADGHGPQAVLNSSEPLMSPSWSPDGRKLAYVTFEGGRPSIYTQDVYLGKREKISGFKGINGAPAWSPDGTRMALVLSKDGSPDIYVMNLLTKKLTRLTTSYGIDTEPVWTRGGDAIVFTSDRGGKPQLYQITLSNRQVKRLTFEGNYNARATLSPDGRMVAMVHGNGNRYQIAVMDLDSGAMQVLTDTSLDESPSFAPNGSMIIYATESRNRGVLSAVSVDGRVRQRLVLQEGDAREPVWAPYGK
ncbi:MAG: Tol-Pal system beta propeller repeat protein TolB [Thiotrichaceae bacterium]|nr:Tol-Pal system beta propeller repeat protein TolB [Thiotrichaceae bacterium]PCI10496.1 MAG: Tol-Pal system beta propeller repeat protein TolB [Thiotrichales bacterium]